MYTTTDEYGIINNYATEPDIYYAVFPSPEQQRNYLLQGALAFGLVTTLILTVLGVS